VGDPFTCRLAACVDSRSRRRKASQSGPPSEASPYQHGVTAQPVPILDDADPDILISRLAGPLPLDARAAFRQAAEAALAQIPCWGEGAAYRAVAVLQRHHA
jgi:hypothetical protein